MTHATDIAYIERQAAILVGKAQALGVSLRISLAPLYPLAMGSTRYVIEAWAARHGVRPKMMPLPGPYEVARLSSDDTEGGAP